MESGVTRARESAAARRPGAGVFVDREEEHRIGAHEERIALRKVVTHHGRTPREDRIARLFPILAVVAESQHLVFGVVQLEVVPQNHMVLGAVKIEAVAPYLLGQDVAVARDDIERVELVVSPPVGV